MLIVGVAVVGGPKMRLASSTNHPFTAGALPDNLPLHHRSLSKQREVRRSLEKCFTNTLSYRVVEGDILWHTLSPLVAEHAVAILSSKATGTGTLAPHVCATHPVQDVVVVFLVESKTGNQQQAEIFFA